MYKAKEIYQKIAEIAHNTYSTIRKPICIGLALTIGLLPTCAISKDPLAGGGSSEGKSDSNSTSSGSGKTVIEKIEKKEDYLSTVISNTLKGIALGPYEATKKTYTKIKEDSKENRNKLKEITTSEGRKTARLRKAGEQLSKLEKEVNETSSKINSQLESPFNYSRPASIRNNYHRPVTATGASRPVTHAPRAPSAPSSPNNAVQAGLAGYGL